ncbi:MAG: DUF4097 family beta strand repeat-containing protein [Rhodothermales bacterium]
MPFIATLLLILVPFLEGPAQNLSSDVMIDRSFDVRPGGVLDMDVNHSDLLVKTSDNQTARVLVRLDGRDMSKARDWFERMDFQVFESPNGIVIRAEQPERSWNSRKTGGAKIGIEVHLPRNFDIVARTSHGDVAIGDLNGRLELVTSHGDVELGRLEGPIMDVQSSHGDIGIGWMSANTISLRTSHADIEAVDLKARTIEARTSHGNVELERTDGDLSIRTSHGRIHVALAQHADADLRTSHGDIEIDTRKDLDARLDLKGARARISSSLVFDGEVGEDRVQGRVGRGTNHITANTSHGSVILKTAW